MEKTAANGPAEIVQTNGEAEPTALDSKSLPPVAPPTSQVRERERESAGGAEGRWGGGGVLPPLSQAVWILPLSALTH